MSPKSVPPSLCAATLIGKVAATANGEKEAPNAFPNTPFNPKAARVGPTPLAWVLQI